MKKKINKTISDHFSKLGKISWEARKKRMLAKAKFDKKLSTSYPLTNERAGNIIK